MNILFLSSWFPYPTNNGSKLRIHNILRGLAQHHDVTLVCFSDEADITDGMDKMRTLCSDVQVVPQKTFQSHHTSIWQGLLTPTPRSISQTFSLEMRHKIERTLQAKSYDLIIASQLGLAAYAPFFRGIPALFEEVEVGVLYDRYAQATSILTRLRHGLTWLKHRRYLAQLLRSFRACTVASHREQQLIAKLAPSYQAVHVIPNCVRVSDYRHQESTQPNQLIFTGSFRYWPNYEAVQWFLREVYPQIQAQIPDVTFTITGAHDNQPIPVANGVTLTGFVEDVRPLIARATASVVPIHSGGGTRLKMLEAMASGTPVITTTKGAEGLDVQHEVEVLTADTPQAFAGNVIRVLRDSPLRQKLSKNAYTKVSHRYDWDATMPGFLNLVEQVASH